MGTTLDDLYGYQQPVNGESNNLMNYLLLVVRGRGGGAIGKTPQQMHVFRKKERKKVSLQYLEGSFITFMLHMAKIIKIHHQRMN